MIKVPVVEVFSFSKLEVNLTMGGAPGQLSLNGGEIRMSVFDEDYKGNPDFLPELLSVAPIPEPGAVAMLFASVFALAAWKKRFFKTRQG